MCNCRCSEAESAAILITGPDSSNQENGQIWKANGRVQLLSHCDLGAIPIWRAFQNGGYAASFSSASLERFCIPDTSGNMCSEDLHSKPACEPAIGGDRKKGGSYAARACPSDFALNPGYHSSNLPRSSSFSARVRTCKSRWASRRLQLICCFLTNRLLIAVCI